jgi:uncharacterized protein (TIGR03067 family)
MRALVALMCLTWGGIDMAMAADQKKEECTPDQFEGTYEITSGEMDGKQIAKEDLHHVKAVIQKKRIVTYDRNEKEVYAATFELQPGENGCHITMTSTKPTGEGVDAFGLIRKDGDTLKLIYALPKGEQPKTFKTQANQHMFVMKKVSASTDASKDKLEKP